MLWITYLVDLGHCDGWGILMEDDGDENADVEQLDFWVRSLDSLACLLLSRVTESEDAIALLLPSFVRVGHTHSWPRLWVL